MEITSMPVIITREGKWFVGACPLLDVATQGKTEEEVKEDLRDLIEEYMNDSDTPKPPIKTIMNTSISITNIPIKMEHYGETASVVTA